MFKFINFIFCFSISVCYCFFAESSDDWLSIINGDDSELISCEQLSDEFCKTLWSSENQGNFHFSDGKQVLYGERRKHIISNAQFIYNQKLVKSRCHLPEDIKRMAGIQCGSEDIKEDLLSKLEGLLSQVDSIGQNKKSINTWIRSVNSILSDFDNIISDTADERSYKEKPDLSYKFWSDYKPADMKIFHRNYYDIKREIMDAIYLQDLDWLRVVELFDEVKKDILNVIDKMRLTSETKLTLKGKINSVKLSLPYEDPGSMNSSPGCATHKNNAFYTLTLSGNRFAFCIGAININSEGFIYRTMAHEIAHSIDPKFFLLEVLYSSPLFHSLRQLYRSDASLTCEKWTKQKNDTFILPSEIYQLPEGLADLDQCLVDRTHLKDLNSDSLDRQSDKISHKAMSAYANKNTFTYLSSPEVIKNGKRIKNEFYMKPKLFSEKDNSYFEDALFTKGYLHLPSVFIQEYKCLLKRTDTEGQAFSATLKEEQAFSAALKETEKLNKIYQYYYLSILGRNTYNQGMTHSKLSKPSSEEFADWIANKAMELKLQRIASVKNRREFVMADAALHCRPESLQTIAKGKVYIEKDYSQRSHPLKRARRLRAFTPKTAELLQCTRGEDIKKLYQNCDVVMERL